MPKWKEGVRSLLLKGGVPVQQESGSRTPEMEAERLSLEVMLVRNEEDEKISQMEETVGDSQKSQEFGRSHCRESG